MTLRKEFSFTAFGWTVGVGFSPGWLLFEVAWETSPRGYFLTLPLLCFWLERAQTDSGNEPWSWGWSLWRLTIWKTEFRLDLDLNIWGIGLTCVEFGDLGIYIGPFNIQVETGKGFGVDFPPGVPTLRLFFPEARSVQPWPPRCDCDPSVNEVPGNAEFDSGPAKWTARSPTDQLQ
jgi:hypothetical protein